MFKGSKVQGSKVQIGDLDGIIIIIHMYPKSPYTSIKAGLGFTMSLNKINRNP